MADEEKKTEDSADAKASTEDGATDAPAGEDKEAPAEEVKKEEATPAKEEEKTDAPEESAGEEVEVPAKFKALVDGIEQMSVLDLHELVKLLEKKFGVSAAAVAVAAPGAGGAGEDEEEKSTFNVELTDAGAQKIAIIKAVKALLGLGLKEAKDMVDGVPTVLKENVSKDEANDIKVQIEEAGGKVELK